MKKKLCNLASFLNVNAQREHENREMKIEWDYMNKEEGGVCLSTAIIVGVKLGAKGIGLLYIFPRLP